MRKRLLIPPLTLIVTGIALELTARALDLDDRESVSIAVDKNLTRLMPDGSDWGVDYLPRRFKLDETGFDSGWGRCDFTRPGPRVLALGDSTTRQVGASPDQPGVLDPPELTWPMLIAARLRADVQVCVIAEDGYHPVDQVIVAEHVAALWPPDLIVTLWCDNDLDDEVVRHRVDEGDQVRVVLHNPVLHAWPPIHWPWLFYRSEALRYVSSRIATTTGQILEVPSPLPRTRSVVDAIRRIDALPGELRAFHLPALQSDDSWGISRVNALADQSGVPIWTIPLPQPREHLRVVEADRIHENAKGHRLVAAKMLPVIATIVPPR